MTRRLTVIALILLFTNFAYAEEEQANFLVIDGNSRISNEEIMNTLVSKWVKNTIVIHF